jgi:hypothetical protein
VACNALSLPQETPRYSEAEAGIVSGDSNIGCQSIADYIPVASFSFGHDVDLLNVHRAKDAGKEEQNPRRIVSNDIFDILQSK